MATWSVHLVKIKCMKVALRSYPGNNPLGLCCNKEQFSYFQLSGNDEVQLTSQSSKFVLQSLGRVRHIQRMIHPILRYRSKPDLPSAVACLSPFPAEAQDCLRLHPSFYQTKKLGDINPPSVTDANTKLADLSCHSWLTWPLHRHLLQVNKHTDLEPPPREIKDRQCDFSVKEMCTQNTQKPTRTIWHLFLMSMGSCQSPDPYCFGFLVFDQVI